MGPVPVELGDQARGGPEEVDLHPAVGEGHPEVRRRPRQPTPPAESEEPPLELAPRERRLGSQLAEERSDESDPRTTAAARHHSLDLPPVEQAERLCPSDRALEGWTAYDGSETEQGASNRGTRNAIDLDEIACVFLARAVNGDPVVPAATAARR